MPDTYTADSESIPASSPVVGCDGGGGALGHPLVYLRIERDGQVVCPYCSRRFVFDGDPGTAAAH